MEKPDRNQAKQVQGLMQFVQAALEDIQAFFPAAWKDNNSLVGLVIRQVAEFIGNVVQFGHNIMKKWGDNPPVLSDQNPQPSSIPFSHDSGLPLSSGTDSHSMLKFGANPPPLFSRGASPVAEIREEEKKEASPSPTRRR